MDWIGGYYWGGCGLVDGRPRIDEFELVSVSKGFFKQSKLELVQPAVVNVSSQAVK